MAESHQVKEDATPPKRTLWRSFFVVLQIVISLLALGVIAWNLRPLSKLLLEIKSVEQSKFVPPKEGTWRFIVSGDSRNCGDVVMPAIAAQAIEKYQPAFYWHLGDLRAIYKIDEDMAGAAQKAGQSLSCESYHKSAWQDFIDHQIVPFGTTRFYLGIGNHEVIPPKTATEFSAQFKDWLLTPRLQMQRQDMAQIAAAKTGPAAKSPRDPTCPPRPTTTGSGVKLTSFTSTTRQASSRVNSWTGSIACSNALTTTTPSALLWWACTKLYRPVARATTRCATTQFRIRF